MAYITFQPNDNFNTKLYTGTNSSNAQTGIGFQPDWIWFKRRDSSAQHSLFDVVRGVTKAIQSNSTDAEATISDALTSFDSDGFTLGADSGNYINYNSATYASWNWKAGGAGSSNSDGDITSTVSANTDAGFSIVTHTGNGSTATIGHGLGAVPKMIFTKKRSASDNWFTYHESLGNGKYILLEATDAVATSSNVWNDTSPTNQVFTRGGPANDNAATYVQYCFAEIKGFSKFGSYIGNGNADGPFVYTGFKPAFVLVKNTTASNNWFIQDTKRAGYNGANYLLKPNTSGAEDTGTHIDILSNGFKTIVSSANCNGNGNEMIYMAFAEEPLVSSNGIPATAR
jgi:hypothetical protein